MFVMTVVAIHFVGLINAIEDITLGLLTVDICACPLACVLRGRITQLTAIGTDMRHTAALGREYSEVTGRFRESEFHWLLSGWQFEERTVASRPSAGIDVVR